jgi:drug/metabolite transporter (DMT)-like permease
MRISSSFTIFNLAPIFTTILTVIFLGGNLRKIEIIAFIVCFFSVILITKPAFIFYASSTEEDHPLGIFFAIIAAGLSGVAVFLNKIIAKDFDVSFNVYGTGIAFAIVSLIINPFTNNGFSTLSFVPFLIAVILSVFFYFSVFIFVSALGIGDPIQILPITYIGIVLNMIYNFFIFGQSCDFLDIMGSCLIIFINIYKTLYQ